MKVKVYVKSSAKAQEKYYEQVIAEAYAENERLFQKTRDLERQIVCMERDFQAMKKRHSDACADRDNMTASYKQVQASISQIVRNFEDTRKELEDEVKRVCEEKQELYAQLEKANETIALREKQIVDMGRKIDALSAEASLYYHAEREVDEWKEVADDLADTVKDLRDQLASAHKRIEEQQRTIADCSDTITTLKTTAELRPQFSNLWQLLKETGMIIDTEGGVHNHE